MLVHRQKIRMRKLTNFQFFLVLQIAFPSTAFAHADVPFSTITSFEALVLFALCCILPCIFIWRAMAGKWFVKLLIMLPVFFFGIIFTLIAAAFVDDIKVSHLKAQYAKERKN